MKNTVFAVVALLLALFAGISILTGSGSIISNAAFYIGGTAAVVGLFRPHVGMIIFLVLCAYSDLIKRLMIVDNAFGFSDIAIVLAMAPLCLGAVTSAVLVQGVFGKTLKKADYIRFVLCSLVLATQALLAIKSGGGVGRLRVVADYGIFVYLLFVIPILYPDLRSITRFLKTGILIFIPVALYGIKQKFLGFSDFEIAYLQSGFTIESRQLQDVSIRAFSTLNAASTLTMVCAACGLLSFLLYRTKSIKLGTLGVLLIIFGVACFATLSRTGWVVFGAGLLLSFLFKRKIGAYLFYGMVTTLGIVAVISSNYVLDNLQDWQKTITGKNDYGRSSQVLRITTLSDRFLGFKNLKNPDNWTLFGVDMKKARSGAGRKDSRAFSHDLVTRSFFRYGAVPCFCALVFGLVVLIKSHSLIYSSYGMERKYAVGALSCLVALMMSVSVGGNIFQFPANVFLWLTVSIILVSLRESQIRNQISIENDSGIGPMKNHTTRQKLRDETAI